MNLAKFSQLPYISYLDCSLMIFKKLCSSFYQQGNGFIEFQEFIDLMEKMRKPSEDRANTLAAFRAFDVREQGNINSKAIRDIMLKTLDPIPQCEVEDLLSSLGLSCDRLITYEGEILLCLIVLIRVLNFKLSKSTE